MLLIHIRHLDLSQRVLQLQLEMSIAGSSCHVFPLVGTRLGRTPQLCKAEKRDQAFNQDIKASRLIYGGSEFTAPRPDDISGTTI